MTAEEIKSGVENSKSEAGWLKEIAYQLALMNEKQAVPAIEDELCFCGKEKGHVGRHKFMQDMKTA